MSELRASAAQAQANLTEQQHAIANKRVAEEAYMSAHGQTQVPNKRLRDDALEQTSADVDEELTRQLQRAGNEGLPSLTSSVSRR